jgi:hypothetical protein
MDVSGTISNTEFAPPTKEDARLLEEICNSKAGKEKGATINWPAFGESPIYEYGGKRVFCVLFPWLCSGGNGDFNESIKVDIGVKDWARQQLFMADGRFAKDKTWFFYALNYAEHRRSMTQGQWFVNNFLHNDEIPCIDNLKEKMKNKDTKFIEKLHDFDQCVPGWDSYWRNKRGELISWIGHHMEQGNGAPSLFVTFSCAEYHWQDIEKLLNARRRIAGDPPISLKSVTEKVRAVNDYSIVIQKYFQARLSVFLENYAKEVFWMHHYYDRFEFFEESRTECPYFGHVGK